MKKKSNLIRLIAYIACMVLIFAVILAHGTLSVARALIFAVVLLVGSGLMICLDKVADKGCELRKALDYEVKGIKVLDLVAFFVVLVLGIYVRIVFLPFETEDTLGYFAHWVDLFRDLGFKTSIGAKIGDYSPMYTMVLLLMSLVPGDSVTIVKIVPIICDFINAFACVLIYKEITGKKFFSLGGILVWAATVFSPVAILNSSCWGMCDGVYTTFILFGTYYLLKLSRGVNKASEWAVIFFALAFSCKFQSVFSLPVLFVFWALQKRSKENTGVKLSQFVWFPVVYFITSIPMFLAGQTLPYLFSQYITEANEYNDFLSLRYYNLYSLIGTRVTGANSVDGYFALGMALALIAVLCVYYGLYKKDIELKGTVLIKVSVLTVLMLVYILPSMHERYAYAGELLIILLAILERKYVVSAIITLACTLVTYADYLLGAEAFTYPVPAWVVAVARLFVIVFFVKDLFISEAKEN